MRKKKKQTKKKPIYGYIILFLPLNTYIMDDDFFSISPNLPCIS